MPAPDDFHAALRHVDEVAAEPSSETAPYEAQYRAIEILHKLLSSELSPAEEAAAKARRGTVYLAVEEPHNAQKDLDAAAAVFFPELSAYASGLPERDGATSKQDVEAIVQKLPAVQVADAHQEFLVHILELLNQLGVLWSNRAQPTRALCYLLACNNLSEAVGSAGERGDDARAAAVVSVRTHAHFYLAQVFGALGFPDESAKYCLATLELQLVACVDAFSGSDGDASSRMFDGAREWVKNCLRLVDYYLDTESLKDAAVCLSACDYMMAHHMPPSDGDDDDSDNREQRAEIFAAWAKIQQMTLQIANLRREGYPAGVQTSTSNALPCPSSMEATLSKIAASDDASALPKMTFAPVSSVTTYDQARDVFKMGVAACEQAKKFFVLEGFVTRHVRVLQQESLLYKRLIAFEPDVKRQIAMHLRRLSLLSPLLGDQLNPRAYCDLLQELYFECAEVAAEIFDLKRSKRPELDDKTNGYALKATHCYQQFVALYYSSADDSKSPPANDVALPSGSNVKLPAQEMGPPEVRALLRGYFGLAHICGKVFFARDAAKTVSFWKKSLEYYEAVLALAKQFDKRQEGRSGESLEQIFGAELAICRDMASLLPEKIDQLVYNGRAL